MTMGQSVFLIQKKIKFRILHTLYNDTVIARNGWLRQTGVVGLVMRPRRRWGDYIT